MSFHPQAREKHREKPHKADFCANYGRALCFTLAFEDFHPEDEGLPDVTRVSPPVTNMNEKTKLIEVSTTVWLGKLYMQREGYILAELSFGLSVPCSCTALYKVPLRVWLIMRRLLLLLLCTEQYVLKVDRNSKPEE